MKEKKCPKCGALIPDYARGCPYCKAVFKEEISLSKGLIIIIAVSAIGIYLAWKGESSVSHSNNIVHNRGTLKKNALVCRTKDQFEEFVRNRDDQAYTMMMLADGKCLFNITNAKVHAEILEGILPYVKVKVHWGDEIFVGWTETTMINE